VAAAQPALFLIACRGLARTALLVSVLIAPLAAWAKSAASPPLEPGVSLRLAEWRARHYRNIRYELQLELVKGAPEIPGRLAIELGVARPIDVILDWRGKAADVTDLTVNGRSIVPRIEAEHLVIPRAAVARGTNRIELRFRAPVGTSGTAITRFVDAGDGAEYLHSLFVPSDASTVFPCFDQPDLKARFDLGISAPADWRIVANAPAISHADGRHRFARTEPLSTYQFAFAAGPFAEIADGSGTRLFVRRSRLAHAEREAPALLALNRESLAWFAGYFGRPFPFAKYDLVLVPELAYGGMEHAGASFLREESVLFPFEPSANDRLRRAQLLLHETSHQWFGDLVTMRWFDDLWLKEGFANFMAAKATEALLGSALPDVHPWIAFNSLKLAAYRTDATRGTTPIWRELDNLASAKSAYGNIVYSKAPAVLRQAEHYVGEKAFRTAVRDFLARHAYGAARWSDLVRALERASGEKLGAWADAWVKRRGMARVRAERAGREIVLTQQNILGEPGHWPMRLRVAALSQGKLATFDVRLTRARTRIATRDLGDADLVYANHGDYGYGQFLLDPASLDFALRHPERIPDALLRSLVLDAVWESVREAELDPARYVELALRWLPNETDDVAAAVMLSRLRVAYLRYLTAARREPLAARIEDFLATQMRDARTASRRIAYWRSYLAAARTPAAYGHLKALLAGKAEIPGVPLRSRDRFHIIEALLAGGDTDAPALLDAQSREDASTEGRRYAFGAAAAVRAPARKKEYFERFLKDEALPESWIEEALGPLNEPGHEALTLPLLGTALEALPRLKRERKIFFVNEWLGAFIGGQSSDAALKTVNDYLAHGTLEPDLRLKVLEAVDPLERIVRIHSRFGN
jgi:aminopeptidase N